MIDEARRRWRDDALVLGEVGAELSEVELPTVRVRLSRALADRAVAAWFRDDVGAELGTETLEQTVIRTRAGALALIGLAISERGARDDEGVTVELSAELVAVALNAADDRERTARVGTGGAAGPRGGSRPCHACRGCVSSSATVS